MTPKIRIAISGGGVAGASLLHALLQHPHLDVHIFESAPAFKEAGVAFGLARNATAALKLISPSATECLERAGGVPMQGVRILLAQGDKVGTMLYEQDSYQNGKQTTTIVQRANYLHEMLSGIPANRMHASKKLNSIKRQADDTVVLHFTDGSVHVCDILVGADGIRSMVRRWILGENDPAANPRNSGSWALMTLQPYEKARASIGAAPVNIEDAREYGWVGNGTMMMHNLLSHGATVQFSLLSHEEGAEGSDRWTREVTAEELRKLYIDQVWPPHLSKAVSELLLAQSSHTAYYLWEHLPARTYIDGPVCLIGDAAHATTPWQGSGGGMCIEDSMILSTLLGMAETPQDALKALETYDEVRRPRTQRVVESSLGTGAILTGRDNVCGLKAEKIQNALLPRWDFIVDFDNSQHRAEAVQKMNAKVRAI